MKVKGSDLIQFFREWPPGDCVYHEDLPFGQDEKGVLYETAEDGYSLGVPVVPDRKYTVESGFLGWQGERAEPAGFDSDFVRVFKKWLKARTTEMVVVEAPKADAEKLRALLKAHGWKEVK